MNYFLPLLFLFVSCAHKSAHIKPNLPDRPYMKDEVSVRTVLMQAHAAYVRGCLKAHQENHNRDKGVDYCKRKADDYLKEEVIAILEQ